VESTIKLMRELFPKAKKIGIVWNPAEVCSEVCTKKARIAAKQYGFELIEQNASNTNEIIDALNSLIDKKIDLFFTSGDNTVSLAVETIAHRLKAKKIPYFTNGFSDVEKGAFLSNGADYVEVGNEIARQAKLVFKGGNTKNIPIKNYVPEKFYLNLALANEFGIKIPDSFIKKANMVRRAK